MRKEGDDRCWRGSKRRSKEMSGEGTERREGKGTGDILTGRRAPGDRKC